MRCWRTSRITARGVCGGLWRKRMETLCAKKGVNSLQRSGARSMPPSEPTHHHRRIHHEFPGQVFVRQPVNQFIVLKPPKGIRRTLERNMAKEREDLGELSDGGLGPCLLPVDDGRLVNAHSYGDLVLR